MTGRQQGAGLGYIPAIDGLRAVAVAAVILYHLWPAALPGGFNGVDIFFVISGFVVTGSVAGKRFESLGALAAWFYARRLVRIMPALAAMLLAAILAAQLFIPEGWLSASIPQAGRFAFLGLSNIVLALDARSYFGPLAGHNPFTHTWSLGVEEQFYLLFPLLLYWRLRSGGERRVLRLVAGLTLASMAASAAMTAFAPVHAFYQMPARFWELGAGMLLYLTIDRWRPRLAALEARRARALAAASLAMIAAGLAIPETPLATFPFALLPVLGAAGLIATVCARPGAAAARMLAARPMVAVGLLSYSLYLWHWPVFVLFRWTVGLHTLPLQLAALAIAVALAMLSYFLVEQPLRTSRRIAAMPRGRVVRRAIGYTLMGLGAGQLLILAHDRISLSRTRDHAAWYADGLRPLDPARSHCRVRVETETRAGGEMTAWIPEGCAVRPAEFTIYAVGDSHNPAYAPSYRQLAAELGVPVRAWTRPGCPFLKLIASNRPGGRCDRYFAALDAELAAARAGDVLFLPGLRMTRLVNQFDDDRDILSARRDAVTPERFEEARRILARIAATGLRPLFEAPKPIFRSPAFRCSDWFNRRNPICASGLTMPRAELEKLRLPVRAAMAQLAAEIPGLTVWDPFPILCPGETCEAVPGGRPLFFDGDHLSGHGNDVLYPGLSDAILRATGRPG